MPFFISKLLLFRKLTLHFAFSVFSLCFSVATINKYVCLVCMLNIHISQIRSFSLCVRLKEIISLVVLMFVVTTKSSNHLYIENFCRGTNTLYGWKEVPTTATTSTAKHNNNVRMNIFDQIEANSTHEEWVVFHLLLFGGFSIYVFDAFRELYAQKLACAIGSRGRVGVYTHKRGRSEARENKHADEREREKMSKKRKKNIKIIYWAKTVEKSQNHQRRAQKKNENQKQQRIYI